MIEFARRLGTNSLSIGIQSVGWLTPLLQAVHILMIGVVFVSVLMIVLRIHGRVRTDEPIDQTWHRFAPWLWTALAVMALTGITLAIGEPLRQAQALSFWLKMMLIVTAVLSVLGLRRSVVGVSGSDATVATRLAAKMVLAMWIAIIFLGRAIAYDVEVWGALSLGANG